MTIKDSSRQSLHKGINKFFVEARSSPQPHLLSLLSHVSNNTSSQYVYPSSGSLVF